MQLSNVDYNADLHLNYSTALKFTQDYRESLKHLKIATAYDPGYLEAKEQLETLLSFLKQVNSHVRNKGGRIDFWLNYLNHIQCERLIIMAIE